MFKGRKKRTGVIMSVLMALFMIAALIPATVSALPDLERTVVKVHKLQSSTNFTGGQGKDAPLSETEIKALGNDVTPLQGVEFTAKRADGTGQPVKATTGADGIATFTFNGTNKFPAGDRSGFDYDLNSLTEWTFEETKVPDGIAVVQKAAFNLSLPMTKEDGSDFLREIHVYPKNVVGNKPVPSKTVEGKTQTVGVPFKYVLGSNVPENIGSYTKFDFVDKLDEALTYVNSGDNATVVKVLKGTAEEATLTLTTDYTINTATANQVTISLTTAGIAKVAGLVAAAPAAERGTFKFSIDFWTKINDKAIMGKKITNNLELITKIGENPEETTPVPEPETPKVDVGGKLFKKVNDKDTGLNGAEFELYKFVEGKVDVNDWDSYELVSAVEGVTFPLKSTADGTFEIKGLAFGKYALKERKAPAGYQLQTAPIPFEVNETSYYADPTAVQAGTDAGTATPMDILNSQRPTIPPTGGIGSVIFVVGGLLVMGVAGYGLVQNKKRKEENEA